MARRSGWSNAAASDVEEWPVQPNIGQESSVEVVAAFANISTKR
jgi:hypothetical protein